MKIDVVIYLLRPTATVDSVRDHLLEKLQYRELPRSVVSAGEDADEQEDDEDEDGLEDQDLDTDDVEGDDDVRMVLLAKQHEEKRADWVEWCQDDFDVSAAPVSSATGAVLLLEAGGRVEHGVTVEAARVFAVTFGTGWSALPRDLVEPDFGLRVAMQVVPPTKVQTLVTRSVDLKSNEKNVYNHAGSELAQFPLDLEAEWLRQTGGGVDGSQGFAAVTGKTSIRLVAYSKGLDGLPTTCTWLLDQFNAAVPEAFRFYENLQPLSQHDQKHRDLEDDLLARIAAQQFDGLTVVLEREDAQLATARELKHGHRAVTLDVVSDDEVWSAVRDHAANAKDYEVERLALRLTDADGKEVLREPLLSFVHAEITDPNGDVWLRMERRWFRATRDYVDGIDRLLAAEVPDYSNRLRMPLWRYNSSYGRKRQRTELIYNRITAGRRGWLCLDQQEIYRHGQSIEPCDLLTPDAHFVHLKNAADSQHVGAAVGQLRGAAYMMKSDGPFRQKMAKYYADHVGTDDLLKKRVTFVLALAREPHMNVYGKMLVAKINILDCGRKVRALGHDFAVCKVDRR